MLARVGIHLLLVAFAAAFVFPFAWMLTTSIKTDEEINSPTIWPGLPRFRASSPYARPPVELVKPGHIDDEEWSVAIPQLLKSARRAVAAYGVAEQLDGHSEAAASVLMSELVGRLDL